MRAAKICSKILQLNAKNGAKGAESFNLLSPAAENKRTLIKSVCLNVALSQEQWTDFNRPLDERLQLIHF